MAGGRGPAKGPHGRGGQSGERHLERRLLPKSVAAPRIKNALGEDIGPILAAAAAEADIPLELLAAGSIAESGLDPYAERWGNRTLEAKLAIRAREGGANVEDYLQEIVDSVWPDISFGYGQRIILFHYLGDRSPTVANILAVRWEVFRDPVRDLVEMARRLASCLAVVQGADLSRVDGDPQLGALVVYNAGHLPDPASDWWQRWAGNVEAYRRALAQAREMI